jgi:hypothetical protein
MDTAGSTAVVEDFRGGLSPDENKYFESGGQTEIPSGSAAGNDNAAANGAQQAQQPVAEGGEGADKGSQFVPHALFHEERSRRKDVQAKLHATERELAELRGKFSVIDRLSQPQQQQQPAREPTAAEDIFGAVDNATKGIADINKRLSDRDAADKETSARNAVIGDYRTQAAQFEATTPDFRAAYSFLLQSRAAELQALGYTDPKQIQGFLEADEFAIAQNALQAKANPAERLYKLAEMRGYKKADPGGQGGQQQQQGANGAQKLDAIQRGQQANKSLNSTGGAAGEVGMTAQQLLRMPMDEFEAWCDKHPAQARRIMGG